jgi:hypothetical protein
MMMMSPWACYLKVLVAYSGLIWQVVRQVAPATLHVEALPLVGGSVQVPEVQLPALSLLLGSVRQRPV